MATVFLCQLAMSEDISVIVEAVVQRIKREISEEKKKLLESNDIKRHLGDSVLDFEVSVFCFEVDLKCVFSQSAVLFLTCNNKHEALKEVLDWGKDKSLEPTPVGNGNDYVGRNPILLSVLLRHQECTELLHQFGYRIPQNLIEHGKEGEKEEKRQKSISRAANNTHGISFFQNLFTVSTKENQVQNVLDFKGYTDPNYLSIAFTKKIATLMKDKKMDIPL